jgi:cob(I)alamin adenosyltransferase
MMALYTKKGDGGTTKVYDSAEGTRMSKSSPLAEALGSLDEVNSYLGQCKLHSQRANYKLGEGILKRPEHFATIVHDLQEKLFIVQAELAGADKKISSAQVKRLEKWTDAAEKELPPIKSFFIAGGTGLACKFDFARTLARRAERRVVLVHEMEESEKGRRVSKHSLAFLNRLSSVLYALARLANHKYGVEERAPSYL